MQHWKAHYRDARHDTDIEIINTEEDYRKAPLSFTLNGITFRGTSLNDFHLADVEQAYEAGQKFSLLKWGGYSAAYHIDMPYLYDLQRYELEVQIPIGLLRKRDRRLVSGALFLSFRLVAPDPERSRSIRLCRDERVYPDDEVVREFSLSVDGRTYPSTVKTLYFEPALLDICRQLQEDYALRCCFTCQYSDYSPYGNADYGFMLCFCRHKEDCLQVHSKDDFFSFLDGKDFDSRQETYLCGQYAPRTGAGGYRGFVPGVTDRVEAPDFDLAEAATPQSVDGDK